LFPGDPTITDQPVGIKRPVNAPVHPAQGRRYRSRRYLPSNSAVFTNATCYQTQNSRASFNPFTLFFFPEVGCTSHGCRTLHERGNIPKNVTFQYLNVVQISPDSGTSLFLRKCLNELAARMAAVAQSHSEWHRRMTSEKLNQANRPFDDSQLQPGMKVYFYNKPPSQQDVYAKGRKTKHLAHYHGPATVMAMPRRRQLELQYEGKSFNRDISLVIPAKDVGSLDVESLDIPSLHAKGEIPKEGELVVFKLQG
jgi:hypothetical protein